MSNLISPTLLAAISVPASGAATAGMETAVPTAASGSDAARFQSLMQAPDASAAPVVSAAPTGVGQVPRPGGSFSDAVVKTLSDASNEFKGMFSAVEKAASGNLTVGDGVKLQYDVAINLVSVDMATKVITKTTQIVDTLVKTQ